MACRVAQKARAEGCFTKQDLSVRQINRKNVKQKSTFPLHTYIDVFDPNIIVKLEFDGDTV